MEQQNFHMLWLEVKTGTNTLENKTDDLHANDPAIPHPAIYAKETLVHLWSVQCVRLLIITALFVTVPIWKFINDH